MCVCECVCVRERRTPNQWHLPRKCDRQGRAQTVSKNRSVCWQTCGVAFSCRYRRCAGPCHTPPISAPGTHSQHIATHSQHISNTYCLLTILGPIYYTSLSHLTDIRIVSRLCVANVLLMCCSCVANALLTYCTSLPQPTNIRPW